MNSATSLVSIVVVNWNGASYIEKCVRSLLDLDYPNFEIIIVDNNSSDDSVTILKGISSKLRIIVNPENFGFARACNIGIKTSKGEFVALFNNDAIADPNWLKELIRTLSSSEQAGAVAGPIYYCESPNKLWFGGARVDGLTGYFWNQNCFSFLPQNDVDFLSGCALAIKREVIEKLGLLDEGYFLYGEDVDLSFGIKRLKKTLLFVPSAKSWHMVSSSKKKAPNFVYGLKINSDLRVIWKNFPLYFLPSALFFRGILMPIMESIYFYKKPTYITIGTKAFLRNVQKLRVTFMARKQADQLGKLLIKNRFKETVQEAKKRLTERQLYW